MVDFTGKARDKRDEVIEKSTVLYSLPVRVGFWVNAATQEEEAQYLYNYRKEHCQLLVQKTKKMIGNLRRPVSLSLSNNVEYGENYQIKIMKATSGQNACGKDTLCPFYLSCLVTEREVDHIQHLIQGCALTISPCGDPCARNVFEFENCKSETLKGEIIYGEDVYIKVVEGGGPPLYIQFENTRVQTIGVTVSIRLTRNPDMSCRFKIFHWRPQMRFETTGTNVDLDGYVLIKHTASGHNLAAEFQHEIPTLFGSERAVTCHTHRDSHRMECLENMWRIIGSPTAHFDLVNAARGPRNAYNVLSALSEAENYNVLSSHSAEN